MNEMWLGPKKKKKKKKKGQGMRPPAKNAKMTNEIWRKPVYDNIMDAHIYSVYNIYYEE